jgi:hypothetical protein
MPQKTTKNKKDKNMQPSNGSRAQIFTSVFKKSKFSRNQLITFAVIFAAIGGYILYRSFAAAPLVASLEAEQMSLPVGASVVTDTSTSHPRLPH